MGNTCKPMAVSFQCMTKSTKIKKKRKERKKEKLYRNKPGAVIGEEMGLGRDLFQWGDDQERTPRRDGKIKPAKHSWIEGEICNA